MLKNPEYSDLLNLQDSTVTEDAATNLRVAIGKGQLLLKKKFTKFDELVHKNLVNF